MNSVSFQGNLYIDPAVLKYVKPKSEAAYNKGITELATYVERTLPSGTDIRLGVVGPDNAKMLDIMQIQDGAAASSESMSPECYFRNWKQEGKNPIISFVDELAKRFNPPSGFNPHA